MPVATPSEIALLVSGTARQKAAYTAPKLLVSALLGGVFIAFGGLLSLVVTGGMPTVAASAPGLLRFISGALFPIGLVLVVLSGVGLFTSDCAVLPFGALQGQLSWKRLARNWILVYAGNFAGALLVAYLFAYKTELLATDPWLTAVQKLAQYKTSHSFLETFIKGIGANWLVCMAVWAALAARDVAGKVIAIWFPVMCFVAFGFEHSIANMFYIPAGMLLGADVNLPQFLLCNLLPATLGNIVGGFAGVALPFWFLFAEKESKPCPTDKPANESCPRQLQPLKQHLN